MLEVLCTEGIICLQAQTAVELTQHVPTIHFPESERVSMPESIDKERYKKASKAMRATMAAVYERHSALAQLLLDAPVAATCELHEPFLILGDVTAPPLCVRGGSSLQMSKDAGNLAEL